MSPLRAALALLLASCAGAVDYDAATASARALLEALVAADTTNPPGNEARAAEIGSKRLTELGLAFEIDKFGEGRANLVARVKGDGSKKPLLLLAHTDVVGAANQPWTVPAHRLSERDGFLYGRGVFDDLAMAAIGLEVVGLLHREKTALSRDVIIAWTGDEESGGSGISRLLQKKRPLIDAEFALNEGGQPLLDGARKVSVLQVQVAEKVYQDFELIATGPTGHSSVPVEGNAIYRLARALARLGGRQEPARLIPATRAYFASRAAVEKPEFAGAMRAVAEAKGELPAGALKVLEAEPSLSALLRTTCVATMVSGGTRVNALPAEARASVNCRILPDESTEQTRARLAAVVDDPGIEIRHEKEFGRAGASPADGVVMEVIGRVSRELWPGALIVPFMSRWATDSRHLRAAGIDSFGILPTPVAEADSLRAHGIDERIPVASLRVGVEFLHKLVLELAR